jgi:hypothetical protein
MEYTREQNEIFARFISFAFQEMNQKCWFRNKRELCNIIRFVEPTEMMTFDFVFNHYSSGSYVFVMKEWFIPLLFKDKWFEFWIKENVVECELKEDDLKKYLNRMWTDDLLDMLGMNEYSMK